MLSRFSHVRLCATPQTTAHQAPQSLGFSRQEHWSGLPFPSRMHESEKWKCCNFLIQGIFLTQESNPGLLHCRQILYCLSHWGSPRILEWVTHPFFRESSWPRNRTRVSCTAGRFLTSWATREDPFSVTDTGLYAIDGCMLNFLQKLPNYFPEWLYHFTFPPIYEWSTFFASLPAYGIVI